MKKTYISPNMLVVQLAVTQHLAVSNLSVDRTQTLDSSSDILVKESTSGDVNLWDEEWQDPGGELTIDN